MAPSILYDGFGTRVAGSTSPRFYVDPSGSNSGPGTSGAPFATMDYARQYITGNSLNANMTDDLYVQVNDGDYYDTHVAFTDADSGTKGYDIHYVGASLGGAKLNGGTTVSGWTLYSGSVYRAAVAGPIVTTMWENGVRAVSARFPAAIPDASFPMSRAPYLKTAGVDGSGTVLQYTPGDLTAPNLWDLSSAQVFDWSGAGSLAGGISRFWFADTIPIQSVNTTTHQLTISAATLYDLFTGTTPSTYYVQGDLSFLVGAGQFYHDIIGGWLYYWPRNTPVGSQTIVIPSQTRVVDFTGSSTSALVHNIVIDGLQVRYNKFSHTARVLAGLTHGLVWMTNAVNVRINRCNINESGSAGIYMHSYVQSCKVTASWIHNCGTFGAYLENYPTNSPDIGDVQYGNLISNVRINNTGELIGDGTGLGLVNSSRNMCEFLDIYNSPKQGVQILGYDADGTKNYAYSNTVRSTRIHAVCQETGDTGGVNLGQTNHKPNSLLGVWVDGAAAASFMNDAAPNGFFTDNNADNTILSDCSGTNCGGAAYRTNSGGSDVVTNCSWAAGGGANHTTANVLPSFPY